MRLLVDTHSLIWAMDEPPRLSLLASLAIQDPANNSFVSAATIWELSIKVGQGKFALSLPYRQWMEKAVIDLKLTILPVTVVYADRQSTLPPHHIDPFDRLLIAQALVEGIPIVSVDAVFDSYGVRRIWESATFPGPAGHVGHPGVRIALSPRIGCIKPTSPVLILGDEAHLPCQR